MNLFKSNTILVIEFRDDQIRFIVGKVNKFDLQIKNHLEIEILNEIYENGEIKDFNQLSYIIKRNLEINNIKTKKTYIVLDTDKIITREIILPVRIDHDYKDFLENHLEDFLPINKEEYVISHQIVDSILNQESSKILVTAAPKTLVNNFHRLIKSSGLKPCVLDIVGNGISKFLFSNEEYGLAVTIGIGYLNTNVVISNLGQFRYWKRINTGYKKILESLKDMEIDKYELIDLLSQDNSDHEYEELNQIARVNDMFQKLLFNDIEPVLKYYLEEDKIDTIYLYEEYSRTSNIEERFSQHFKCRCQRINVLDDINFKGDILKFAGCIGSLIRI